MRTVIVPRGPDLQDRVAKVVRYLVAKRLSGDIITLVALREYFVNWRSPAEIAARYRIQSKYRVRGWVQRVTEHAGSYQLASRIIERAWRLIYQVQPIVIRAGGRWVCLLCNEEIARPEAHVRKVHKAEIEAAVEQILAKLNSKPKRR